MHLEILHEGKGSKTGKENLREHTLREGGHATCSKQQGHWEGKQLSGISYSESRTRGARGGQRRGRQPRTEPGPRAARPARRP